MLNQMLIKEEFKSLQDVVYVNLASLAISPLSVQKAYQDFFNDYIEYHGVDVKEKFKKTMQEARLQLASLIHAEPLEIGFVKNTSEGIGIIANGYPFRAGENIIIIDQEHAANKFVWIELQKQGVELRMVKTRDKNIYIKDIIAAIDDHTKAIAIASVEYASGIKNDLEAIGRLCQAKGILFIIDAIQSIGRLKIDVKAMHIDYLACGGHKGLLATYGVGFVYCHWALVDKITPPYACHQSARVKDDQNQWVLQWRKDSRKFEAGCLNYAGIAAVNAGVKLINQLQIDQIETHILGLEEYLLDQIKDLPFSSKNPQDKSKRSGIICIEYPLEIKHKMIGLFNDYKIIATFREDYIRISLGFYNTKAQMMVIAKALKKAAQLIEER